MKATGTDSACLSCYEALRQGLHTAGGTLARLAAHPAPSGGTLRHVGLSELINPQEDVPFRAHAWQVSGSLESSVWVPGTSVSAGAPPPCPLTTTNKEHCRCAATCDFLSSTELSLWFRAPAGWQVCWEGFHLFPTQMASSYNIKLHRRNHSGVDAAFRVDNVEQVIPKNIQAVSRLCHLEAFAYLLLNTNL